MATGKCYYWMKLRRDFLYSDIVDFLMKEPHEVELEPHGAKLVLHGADLFVFYQFLCMSCLNNDGKLQSTIGEIVVPFDEQRIQRDCKYFSLDFIHAALVLFEKIDLLYRTSDGTLAISNFDSLVGSETDYSIQKRKQRKRKKATTGSTAGSSMDNVHTERE